MIPTYRIHFLGCKSNQSDALSVAGMLHRSGWKEADEETNASLLVVQSCTVTLSADAQARQMVRKLKRENPGSKILMTGCFAQQLAGRETQLPEADYIVGNLHPRKMEILSEIAGKAIHEPHPDFPMPAAIARTRPFIKIQEGCDAHCSYCIIPAVRGNSRSLPPEEVLRRIESFRDAGYCEMVLTGISMGGYGKDLSPKSSLAELIRRIEHLAGDFKIRLSSVEPEEVDDAFIESFTSASRFQPHVHLPLQSAADRVLKKMRRQYLFRRYRMIVDRLFSRIPELNLGTDLLVGFPEEDHDAYLETYRYVQEAPFSYCHVFPFSPRPGTAAETYRMSARHQEVTERAAELRNLAWNKNLEYRMKFIGRSLRALMIHGTKEALTDNYIRVQISKGQAGKPAHETVPDAGVVSVQVNAVVNAETFGTIQNTHGYPPGADTVLRRN